MTKWTPQTTLIVLGVTALGLWYFKGLPGKAANAVNPVNPDNIFAGGVNNVGKAISMDEGWSLGGWLYKTFNDVPTPIR
ncbi:hypothetical protein [Marinobacter adhaerens]|uniref:hypothetical protein n=1 Tax=Marinobacter adhaerens TaxID=1033846 RepID=UPI003D2E7DE2